MFRTLTSAPVDETTKLSPTDTLPEKTLPVTISPTPCLLNCLSTASLKYPPCLLVSTSSAITTRCSYRSFIPRPSADDTGNISAPLIEERLTTSNISDLTAFTRSSETLSIFVSAITPSEILSKSIIDRCSSVCGIKPSSAATTNIAQSTPNTPANILRINLSCPGTSTKPSVSLLLFDEYAKPKSIDIPLFFSSGSRSVSTPVNALTNEVFP